MCLNLQESQCSYTLSSIKDNLCHLIHFGILHSSFCHVWQICEKYLDYNLPICYSRCWYDGGDCCKRSRTTELFYFCENCTCYGTVHTGIFSKLFFSYNSIAVGEWLFILPLPHPLPVGFAKPIWHIVWASSSSMLPNTILL